MPLQLPPEQDLERYMRLLERAIVVARFRAYATDPQLADLLDAVHNLPGVNTPSARRAEWADQRWPARPRSPRGRAESP